MRHFRLTTTINNPLGFNKFLWKFSSITMTFNAVIFSLILILMPFIASAVHPDSRRRLSCQIFYSFWDKTTLPFDFIFWLKWKFQWNWKTMRSKEGKKSEWEKLFLLSPKPHVFSGNQKFVFQLLPQRFTSWRMKSTMQFEPLSLKGNVPIIKKPFNESFS